ncbi:MAG: hypothetical protein ACRCZP_17630 [Phycicoccus sp.]
MTGRPGDLAAALARTSTPPRVLFGALTAWNATTRASTVQLDAAGDLTDLPVLDTGNLAVGAAVAVMWTGDRWMILGRVYVP